jgi:hypothetical protein
MYDSYEIAGAVFSPDHEESLEFAREIDIPLNRIYPDFDTLITEELKLPESERIQVCSVQTPNFLHFPMAKKLLDNGFHVICEKPMTTTCDAYLYGLSHGATNAGTREIWRSGQNSQGGRPVLSGLDQSDHSRCRKAGFCLETRSDKSGNQFLYGRYWSTRLQYD